MPKFRKTALIDAVQWTGENFDVMRGFAGDDVQRCRPTDTGATCIRVYTREGLSTALEPGYWIATDGVSFWPIADDFMRENYEPVEED